MPRLPQLLLFSSLLFNIARGTGIPTPQSSRSRRPPVSPRVCDSQPVNRRQVDVLITPTSILAQLLHFSTSELKTGRCCRVKYDVGVIGDELFGIAHERQRERERFEGNTNEERTMHRACCVSWSLPAGRVVAVRVHRQGQFSIAAASSFGTTMSKGEAEKITNQQGQFSIAAASSFGSTTSKGEGEKITNQQGQFSVAAASSFGTTTSKGEGEKKITVPDRKSEERLQAVMSPGEERRGAVVQQQGTEGKRPVVLLDVMDTIVRDPFHVDMPAFFGLTFKELLACKHPTAWIEFEKGLLTEEEFAVKLFNDRRGYDYEGLKQCMANGYKYLEGMEDLLQRLKATGIDMHIFSNYPTWYTMIEDKLNLSQHLPWTFVSCHTGLRKPSQEAFLDAAEWLSVHPSDCVFIDDQPRNIEAAKNVGMRGIQFQNSQGLEKELALCGISLEPLMRSQKAS